MEVAVAHRDGGIHEADGVLHVEFTVGEFDPLAEFNVAVAGGEEDAAGDRRGEEIMVLTGFEEGDLLGCGVDADAGAVFPIGEDVVVFAGAFVVGEDVFGVLEGFGVFECHSHEDGH